MTRIVALLDANVLYPAPMRDLLIQLGTRETYAPRWTNEIHREWIDALLRTQPQRDPQRLELTRSAMDQAVRDALITDYAHLIPKLDLPDPDDRHVLAAAIHGGCSVIVTQNLADFPADALAPHGIERRHPDAFLVALLTADPDAVVTAVQIILDRLKHPPLTLDVYLDTLRKIGLAHIAHELDLRRDAILANVPITRDTRP